MRITQTGASDVGEDYIQRATSDCGRVHYYPHGERTLIDGRDVWRGVYLDQTTGQATSEAVSSDIWAVACALYREVDEHNRRVSRAAQQADFDRQGAREDAEIDAILRVGDH